MNVCATLPLDFCSWVCYNLIVGWGYGYRTTDKKFQKSLKKLLTNGLNYDIIVNVRWGKQPTKPNKKNKKIQKKA
jgi:hypothetical protein